MWNSINYVMSGELVKRKNNNELTNYNVYINYAVVCRH